MGDSKSEKRLKIIEWNINCCKTSSLKLKKWNTIAKYISTKSPDILVLTECGTDFDNVNFREMLKNLTNTEWEVYYNENPTYNYIAVLVSKNSDIKLAIPKESDFGTEMHPDRVAVEITFKDDTSIRVLGIRMRTGGSTLEQRILQNIQLVHDIQALEPDIIIGDFNTYSEMESLHIYNIATWKSKKIIYEGKDKERKKLKQEFCEWDKWLESGKSNENPTDVLANFCNLIGSKNKKYQYWAGDKRTPFSYKPIRSNISTAPDTLIWNSNKILLSEPSEDNDKPNPRYYPEIAQGKKPSDVVKDWPSDHCMLIADIKIKRKQ